MNALILGRDITDFVYEAAPGLWVITAYYNPMGYASRRRNYELFAQTLRQSGIPLLTVECAFDGQEFDLPVSSDIIRVRGRTPLWQKERLLNLALGWLPKSCTSVAWLDADLVFLNPGWARELLNLLEQVPVAQVFKECLFLPEDYRSAGVEGQISESFTHRAGRDPKLLHTANFHDHGHTGYGWAARRELLDEHGLYECAIAGSADHFMAHAAMGDLDSACINRMLIDPSVIDHFRRWGEAFFASIQGRMGTVNGRVCHLWHGNHADRRYSERHIELAKLGFNPGLDLISRPGRPLELRDGPRHEALAQWFQRYFAQRREDGLRVAA